MTVARGKDDGKPSSLALNANGIFGKLFIDDGTGFVSASTPTNEVVDATPVTSWTTGNTTAVVGGDAGAVTGLVSAGSLTVNRAGLYFVQCSIGSILSGNAAVCNVTLQKSVAGGAFAVIAATDTAVGGGSLEVQFKFAGTAVLLSGGFNGFLRLAVGDALRLVTTSDVGTVTIKKLQFGVILMNDLANPTPQ